MRLFLLGGSSKTGKEMIKRALDRGHEVVAGEKHAQNLTDLQKEEGAAKLLKVAEVDILDSASMVTQMKGCDCVISCLSPDGFSNYLPWSSVNLYSGSIGPITAAMKEVNVTKIIALSSWCTKDQPGGEKSKLFDWFLKPICLGGVLQDLGKMEDFLVSAPTNQVNYTIVKSPVTADDKSCGEILTLLDGEFNPDADGCMSRVDLVTWVLDNMNNEAYYGKKVVVGNPKKN